MALFNRILYVFSLCFLTVTAESTQPSITSESPKVVLKPTTWFLTDSSDYRVGLYCKIDKFNEHTNVTFTIDGTVVCDSSTGFTGL